MLRGHLIDRALGASRAGTHGTLDREQIQGRLGPTQSREAQAFAGRLDTWIVRQRMRLEEERALQPARPRVCV